MTTTKIRGGKAMTRGKLRVALSALAALSLLVPVAHAKGATKRPSLITTTDNGGGGKKPPIIRDHRDPNLRKTFFCRHHPGKYGCPY